VAVPGRVRGWSLWRLRRPAVYYLLAVELLSVVLLGLALRHGIRIDGQFWRAVLLLGMTVAYGEAGDRIERLNKYLSIDESASVNQNSVLCFAGLLILPISLAAALVVAVYLHTYYRYRRWRMASAYKNCFTAASVLLATFAGYGVLHALGASLGDVGPVDALVVLLCIGVYTTTNLVLLLVCLRLVSRAGWRELLPDRHIVGYENTTLLFGAFAGIVLLHAAWLSPMVLFLVASLHRASLVTDLQHRARTDAKTGLLNAGGWQLLARQHLAQCQERRSPAAVLLVDLDHFKAVNDTHGHLAGDAVLKEVADVLVGELRGYDAVGRYGGEEFIALLPGASAPAAVAIAERVRRRIGEATEQSTVAVTVSVGIAVGQAHAGPSLEDIIDAADTALYQAKTAGRNRVCLAPSDRIRVRPPQVERRAGLAPLRAAD